MGQVAGIDVASDATLSGIAIGSLAADASSTAGAAAAAAGDNDSAIGAALRSLIVVEPPASLVLDSSIPQRSLPISVLRQPLLMPKLAKGNPLWVSALWSRTPSNAASPSAPGEDISVAEPVFDDVFNITIASDSAITAQAFNNLDAFANSTSGNSTASAGDELSRVAGIEADIDISIGGLSDLMAQAQGTADSEASAVSGSAEADSWMQSMGIEDLEMLISSDSDLSAISSIFGSASAESTDNFADAVMTFDATGIDGITIQIGGINELSSTANSICTAQSKGVSDMAETSANMDQLVSMMLTFSARLTEMSLALLSLTLQ